MALPCLSLRYFAIISRYLLIFRPPMSFASFPQIADSLVAIGQYASQRQWCAATGGNFSARLDSESIAITASGIDKGRLTPEDILRVDLAGRPINSTRKPSDETLLHLALYALDPTINAVLHTHSVASTVLSKFIQEPMLRLHNYEMLKPLRGVTTHDTTIEVPIVNNTQDMYALADEVKKHWDPEKLGYAVLVRGHGCYFWGGDLQEAQRHLETYEFLFACELELLKLCR